MYHLAAVVEELSHVIELVVVVDYIVAVVVDLDLDGVESCT